MWGEEEGAATGGEYCTMGAGTAMLQMMTPDVKISTKTQELQSDRTVVRLHGVHALAYAVKHEHAMLSCNAKHKLEKKTRNESCRGTT
jgi:hypothetical protein